MTPMLAALAGALAAAGANAVEVAFLPDQPDLPPLVVRVSQDDAGHTIAWAIPGEVPASGVLLDRKVAPRSSLLALPQAPRGAALSDDGAVLVVSIDNAGDWARRYAAATPPGGRARARVAGISVEGERALRLVAPALGAPPGPATLVGASIRIPGVGVSMPAQRERRALVRAGADTFLATPTPVDAAAACGGEVAVSFSSDRPPLRLVAAGNPTCAGALAAVRVTGVRLGSRQDQPVVGVVITAAP